MPYVDPKTIEYRKQDRRVIVSTPFWSVVHDLDRGGAPVDLRFAHGREGNVLKRPLASIVDNWSDDANSAMLISTRRVPDGLKIVFKNVPGKSRIHFQAIYHYTPYYIRREIHLEFPKKFRARHLNPLFGVFDKRFTHWSAAHDPLTKKGRAEKIIGPHYDQDDGEITRHSGLLFTDNRPPGWMSVFQPGGQGIQIAPTGGLIPWETPVGIPGRGCFCLSSQANSIKMNFLALASSSPALLSRKLVFAICIAPVNLPENMPQGWRTVMVGNPPFPEDCLLKTWADNGVELVVIMEGAAWGRGTDRFWKTGVYPCYADKKDMRDLDRMIRTVHRLGMKIVPYTCPTELHPEMYSFPEKVPEWRQEAVLGGATVYHPAGKSPGGCYGALVCPDSEGWRNYYLHYVKTLLARHDFDGLYLDNIWKNTCYNSRHGPSHHGGLDGLWNILGSVRGLLGPEKLMICHNGEFLYLAPTNNFADMIVTLEGVSWFKNFRYDLKGIHRVLRAFSACRVAMVPCSTWYRVPPPHPPQTGLRDGIIKGLLLGSIPYSYTWWETRWGYKDRNASLRDPRGLYAAFRRLKSLHLETLTFDDCFGAGVRTNYKDVLGARYYGKGREVLIIGNISERDRKNIRWSCGEGKGNIPFLPADGYRFIELCAKGK